MSDGSDFRARASEIFRQLRAQSDSERTDETPVASEKRGPYDDLDGQVAQPLGEATTFPPASEAPDQAKWAVSTRPSTPLDDDDTESGSTGDLAPASDPGREPSIASTEHLIQDSSPSMRTIPPPRPPISSPSTATSQPDVLTSPPPSAASSVSTEQRSASPAESESPISTLRHDPLAGIDLADEPGHLSRAGLHPGSERPLPRIMAIANQKGGVGKTTTAVNLGAALAELQYRVLVVDLDPQGNATTGLGINARNLESSVYDVILHDTPTEDVIEPTTLRNLFVVPATIDLAGAEIELVPVFSREIRLRKALEAVRDDFDFILIDCPPSLGLLTVNGLAAANEVVVPIQCEYYALEGLGQLLRNVNLVQANLNAGLDLSTIILTMYDARTRLAEQVVGEVRAHFGARVCRNVVPRTVRLSEAPSFGQPIIVFDPSSRGAIAYRELAKEVSGGAAKRAG